MSTEDRLRAALRDGAPEPLDAAAIVASARRRRAVGLARVGAVAAAVVLVAGVGPRVIGGVTSNTAVEPGTALESPEPAPASAERAAPGAESRRPVIPGRALLVEAERWCLVATAAAGEAGCAPRSSPVQRVADDAGRTWLVLLAPSGPRTTTLQIEQSTGWVSLRTSPVPGSNDLWVGVVPGDAAPEPPRGLRGLDAGGEQIWRG